MGKVCPRGDGDGVLTPDGEFPVTIFMHSAEGAVIEPRGGV